MQIAGVSVKLVGDQAKLMENISKSWTGSTQGKFSGKAKPQEEILTGGADFASIIPSGFLLLHKDLQTLIDSKSGQKSGLMTIMDALGPILVAAGAVAIAGAIVKGLFAGNSEKSSGHIQDIIDELNMGLTADDIKGYPEVIQAQKDGLATYMKCYFIAQGTSAVVSETLGAVGTGAAAAVKNLVNSLLGKETKDEAQLHLKAIIDQIIIDQDPKAWSEEAQQAGTPGPDGTPESSLHKEVKIGIMTYLGLWFASQAAAMTVETLAGGLGTAIGTFGRNLYNSLLGKNTDDKAVTHLKTLIDAIILVQSKDAWSTESVDKSSALYGEVRLGIMTYLGLWFAAQAAAMTAETLAGGLGASIGSFFNGLFTSLFGKRKPSTLEAKLQEIISTIITNVNSKDQQLIGSSEVQDAVRKGMAGYVTAYFQSIAFSATAGNTGEAAGEAAGEAVKGFVSSLMPWNWGKNKEKKEDDSDPMTVLGNKMQDVIAQVTKAINPAGMTSKELTDLAQNGIRGFVEGYFQTLSSNLKLAELGNSVGGIFSSGNNILNEDITAIILGHVKTALSDLKVPDIQSSLNSVMAEGIGNIALTIFETENSKIKSWYSSSLTKDQVKTALGGISETYLNAVKTSIENGFKVETVSTVNSKADSRIIEALAQIQAILNSISGDTGVIKDKQSLVMFNGGTSGEDEPTVYSSLSGSESR